MSTTNSEPISFLTTYTWLGYSKCITISPASNGTTTTRWMDVYSIASTVTGNRPIAFSSSYSVSTRDYLIFKRLQNWIGTGIILVCLLGWSILVGDLQIDLTFQGCKDWTEVQIGQQIEMTEMPMPGLPSDFYTLAKWVFIGSFALPWIFWWVYLPHEFVWRGWVASWAKESKRLDALIELLDSMATPKLAGRTPMASGMVGKQRISVCSTGPLNLAHWYGLVRRSSTLSLDCIICPSRIDTNDQ